MAGTLEGGRKSAATNKQLYGPNFYKKIGSKGGTKTHLSGKLAKVNFANDDRNMLDKILRKPTRAQLAGRKGGAISKRGHAAPIPTIPLGKPVPETIKQTGGYFKAIRSAIPPHDTVYIYVRKKKTKTLARSKEK